MVPHVDNTPRRAEIHKENQRWSGKLKRRRRNECLARTQVESLLFTQEMILIRKEDESQRIRCNLLFDISSQVYHLFAKEICAVHFIQQELNKEDATSHVHIWDANV